jgi:hypothetical protein
LSGWPSARQRNQDDNSCPPGQRRHSSVCSSSVKRISHRSVRTLVAFLSGQVCWGVALATGAAATSSVGEGANASMATSDSCGGGLSGWVSCMGWMRVIQEEIAVSQIGRARISEITMAPCTLSSSPPCSLPRSDSLVSHWRPPASKIRHPSPSASITWRTKRTNTACRTTSIAGGALATGPCCQSAWKAIWEASPTNPLSGNPRPVSRQSRDCSHGAACQQNRHNTHQSKLNPFLSLGGVSISQTCLLF